MEKKPKQRGTYRYFYCSPFIQQQTFSHFLSQLDNVYVHKKPSKKHYVAFSKEKKMLEHQTQPGFVFCSNNKRASSRQELNFPGRSAFL